MADRKGGGGDTTAGRLLMLACAGFEEQERRVLLGWMATLKDGGRSSRGRGVPALARCYTPHGVFCLFFPFDFSACVLSTPAWSNVAAAPGVGAVAPVHAGVSPAHGRHRTTESTTARYAQPSAHTATAIRFTG